MTRFHRSRHSSPARKYRIFFTAIAGTLLLFGAGRSFASHADPTVLEQHWELLSEVREGLATGETSIDIQRGTLPGGTSKFDPQPTVSFEVAGRTTGGTGSGGWRVTLQYWDWDAEVTVELAEVVFGASDTAYSIKTDSFPWPSSDVPLESIRIESEGSGLNLPGTFDVHKAYLKIHQEGTIKKTVGRVPLAAAQTVTATSDTDVVAPAIYEHTSGDFLPAPTITLQIGGGVPEGGAELRARLVDQDLNYVAGSQVSLPSWETAQSGALSLTDGEEYRLQAYRSGSEGTARIAAADLVFEQSTTDTHGLEKTVGWYPGVVTPAELDADEELASFPFNAPAKTNRFEARAFAATLKASGGQPSVELYDRTGGALRATTGSMAGGTYRYRDTATVADSAAGNDLDARANVGIGTSTTVSASVLRIAYELRDIRPPIISGYSASPFAFSPNGDGTLDQTTLAATLSDDSTPIGWQLDVKDAGGTTVRTYAGSGASVSRAWDGKNASGAVVADGIYTALLTATDAKQNSASASQTVVVDTVAPSVGGFGASPNPFSPNVDGTKDATTFSATITPSASWTLEIRNGSGSIVRSFDDTGTDVSQAWDGKNTSGATVADGSYTATLRASDPAGNSASPQVVVTVDNTAPVVSSYTASPDPFSPNDDGTKDTTTLTATLTDGSAPLTWEMFILNSAGSAIRSYSGSGASVSVEWDGKNSSGETVAGGTYRGLLNARDDVGNLRSSSRWLTVDLAPPAIGAFQGSPASFSPNGDGAKDATTFSATISDSSGPLAWSMAVKNSSNTVVRSYTGSVGFAMSQIWDGKDASGATVSDGIYTATLTATDTQNLSASASASVTVDNAFPAISDYAASLDRFSPNSDGTKDATTFSAGFSEQVSWTLLVKDATEATRRSYANSGTTLSETWNGKDSADTVVSDGPYAAVLTVTDPAGNKSTAQLTVTVDRTAPSIDGFAAAEPVFSPNADGTKDTTSLVATLSDDWTPITWIVEIANDDEIQRSFTGSGSSVSLQWDGRDSDGNVVADGSYTATLRALDAGGSSRTETRTLLADTTPPRTDRLLPAHRGNTVYTSQPLGAMLSDTEGSGIDADTIALSFGGTTYQAPVLSYDATTGWAKTPGVPVIAGSDYEASLAVRDTAGNLLSKTWTFRGIAQPSLTEAQVEMWADGVDTGIAGATPGTRRWSFDPHLILGRRILRFQQGSAHPGWGIGSSVVDLSSARASLVVNDQSVPWAVAPYPPGTTKTVHQQIAYTSTNKAVRNVRMRGIGVRVPSVTLDLPLTATKAKLAFTDPVMTNTSVGGLCADPTTGASGCSPDPLRVFIHDRMADSLEQAALDTYGEGPEDEAALLPEDHPPASFVFSVMNMIPDPENPSSADGMWTNIWPRSVQVQCRDLPALDDDHCFVDDVGYPAMAGLITPADYGAFCQTVAFCESASHVYDEDVRWACINRDNGRDSLDPEDAPKCQQTNVTAIPHVVRNPEYTWFGSGTYCSSGFCRKRMTGAYLFAAGNQTDWGYADAVPTGREELGIHWQSLYKDDDTGRVRDGQWIVSTMPDGTAPLKRSLPVGDYYPEESAGHENYSARMAQLHCGTSVPAETNWGLNLDFGGGDGLPPYGFTTGKPNTKSDNPNDHGWPQWTTRSCIDPDSGQPVTWFKRILYGGINGFWRPLDEGTKTRTDGFLNASFGHLKQWFDYSWSLSGPGCGIGADAHPGCDLLGFSYDPERKEKEETFEHPEWDAFTYKSNF